MDEIPSVEAIRELASALRLCGFAYRRVNVFCKGECKPNTIAGNTRALWERAGVLLFNARTPFDNRRMDRVAAIPSERLDLATLQSIRPADTIMGMRFLAALNRGFQLFFDNAHRDHPESLVRDELAIVAQELDALASELEGPPGEAGGDVEWVRADDAARWSGLDTGTILKQAKARGWQTKKSGRMNCYRLTDLKQYRPDKTWQAKEGRA